MKNFQVEDEGHVYSTDPNDPDCNNILTFIKRINGQIVNGGVQNEDVIEVLLDRLNYLQKKLPCRENALAITKLEEALMWLERRTQKRVAQNVETTDTPHV